MRQEDNIFRNIDWVTILLYTIFVFAGWLNIFAADYNPVSNLSILNFDLNSGKQLVWILSSVFFIILPIFIIDYKFYSAFAYVIYGFFIFLLVITIFVGADVKGSRSWINLGAINIQPAEFAKFATALALARFLGQINVKWEHTRTKLISYGIIALPAVLILLQQETGLMLVFGAFVLVLYRQGLSGWVLVLGVIFAVLFLLTLIVKQEDLLVYMSYTAAGLILLSFLLGIRKRTTRWFRRVLNRWAIIASIFISCCLVVLSVDYAFKNLLKPYQQERILITLGLLKDPKDRGYNVEQSKIAIGSGEIIGKGYLQGTQTKLNYVPEQSTDFIFCTVGEEHGWIGSSLLIILYAIFLLRLIYLAERQRDRFAKIYGYSVACIMFTHFAINIGMTIGLFPVVGIPLPFFSYGGSSLWSFTILLFIFLKLDAHRRQVLGHD